MKQLLDVVLLATETANKDCFLFRRTYNIYGNKIFKPLLEWDDNPTYIDNAILINSGKAATNVLERYDWYNLYIMRNNVDIHKGELHWCSMYKAPIIADDFKEKRDGLYSVVGTTDKSQFELLRTGLLPLAFVQAYVRSQCSINQVLVEYMGADIRPDKHGFIEIIGFGKVHVNNFPILKTRPDSTIIISPAKTYTRSDIISFLEKYLEDNVGNNWSDFDSPGIWVDKNL